MLRSQVFEIPLRSQVFEIERGSLNFTFTQRHNWAMHICYQESALVNEVKRGTVGYWTFDKVKENVNSTFIECTPVPTNSCINY